MKNSAHLLTRKDLGALKAYSYENRDFTPEAVLGGIKDDLL